MRDRNLRVHLALGVLAGSFAAVVSLAPGERAVLLLCVAAVISAEAANTAVEAIVDLVSPVWNERARIAKDSAAAAVLVLAGGSVLAFAAIAGGRLETLRAAWPALALPAAGAALAAVVAAVLPWPFRRPRAVDAALALAAVAGLASVARAASSQTGTCAAALCLAISFSAASRRGRSAPS